MEVFHLFQIDWVYPYGTIEETIGRNFPFRRNRMFIPRPTKARPTKTSETISTVVNMGFVFSKTIRQA